MTDMTSRETLEAIDRAMKEVAAHFAKKGASENAHPQPETEFAEEPAPFTAPRD